MQVDEVVSLSGTVLSAKKLPLKDGGQFVRAVVETDDGSIEAVWWTAAKAPMVGQRVSLRGTVKQYQGKLEVHVDSSKVEQPVPSDPLARVLRYYIGCVEAEAFDNMVLSSRSGAFLELSSGVTPMFSTGPVAIAGDKQSRQWSAKRRGAIGETLLLGYPVVVGRHPERKDGLAVTPLFTCEVALTEKDDRFHLERLADQFEVNPAALDLLGLNHEERDEILATLADSAEFESSADRFERLRVGLAIVTAAAVVGNSAPLDAFAMTPVGRDEPGIYNSSIVVATEGGSQFTKRMLEELEEIVQRPEDLHTGPLGVLLGAERPPEMPVPSAHPIVVPSTLRQDQAVHAAMSTPFTVVTGPPGTGKSQVLVNVVAAALAEGQSVLFASKNNKAVDVVVDRIRGVSPHANVMRAGSARMRGELASSIGDALGRENAGDVAAATTRQVGVTRSVDATFARLVERRRLEAEVERLGRSLATNLALLPPGANLNFDRDALQPRLERTKTALQAFAQRLPMLRRGKRWRMHEQRLDEARAAVSDLNVFLAQHNLGHADLEPLLVTLSKPTRSTAPRNGLSVLEPILAAAHEASVAQQSRADIAARIETDFQLWSIEDALADLTSDRLAAGRALMDAIWGDRVAHHRGAANEARLLQADIQSASSGGAGARNARSRISRVLPALPVWGVTNLSAGTNFPLERGLFDLVVIDEASQCDVPAAIPLLYRAKRALIIGDQRQLIHITQIGPARNKSIAKRWEVDESALDAFSYTSRSLFTLAASRLGEPLMLDLHFRSRSSIIDFSNRRFYGGRLEVCTPPAPVGSEPSIRWIDVNGAAERGRNGKSWRNTAEAREVVNTLRYLLDELGHSGKDIGVVAPFRAQVEEVRLLADEVLGGRIRDVLIESAHRFQGDERSVMIFSPVVSANLPQGSTRFAADPNLLNVALTRAKDRLIVIGDRAACLQSKSLLAEFAEYVSRLEASAFDSPLELALFEELLRRGVPSSPGQIVAGYRLDLGVEHNGRRIDVECDGAPFHTLLAADAARDSAIEMQGWTVLRFSGRELSRDVSKCADRVLLALGR